MNPNHTKESWATYMREWRRTNPRAAKSNDLKKRFGITLVDYERMLENQKGVCKICQQPEMAIDRFSGLPRALAVDHCHTTMKVRGLLCTTCNTAIGLLQEDQELFRKAAEYLTDSMA